MNNVREREYNSSERANRKLPNVLDSFQLCPLPKCIILIPSLVQVQLADTAFCDKFTSLIQ